MKKILFPILASVLIAFAIMPFAAGTVFADGSMSWTDLKTAAEAGGTVTLSNNVTRDAREEIEISKNTTIDLNGYSIDGGGSNGGAYPIFDISVGKELIIEDNSNSHNSSIKNVYQASAIANEGSLVLNGCAIRESTGGVDNSGDFTMIDGIIGVYGTGVTMHSGSFILSSGSITGCDTGIYVKDGSSKISLEKGSVSGNTDANITYDYYDRPSQYITGTCSGFVITDSTNGKVTINEPYAVENDTVSITVTPDEDCYLSSLKVEDADGNPVTVTGNSFVMPGSYVTVTATFKAIIATPTGKTLTYNGQSQTGVETGTGYTLSGTTDAVDAGSYQATATLEEGYEWDDETSEPKTISWKIEKATINVTAPEGKTFTYNGKAQTGVASGANYTLSGTLKATNAGSYTSKAALNTNANYTYKWSDGTTAAKTINWKISKATNTFKIKARTATVKFSAVKNKNQKLGVTKVIKFTNKGQGAKTYVKKSGNKKITIAKKTGKVTVKKGLKRGTYKVKVKVKAAGTANYKASAWKVVTFTVTVR